MAPRFPLFVCLLLGLLAVSTQRVEASQCTDATGHLKGCTGNDVTPIVSCACRLNEWQMFVQYAYTNTFTNTVTLAAGSFRNYMTPGALSQGQTSSFLPGTHPAHAAVVNCSDPTYANGLAWVIQQGRTDSALASCVQESCDESSCGQSILPASLLEPRLVASCRVNATTQFVRFGYENKGASTVAQPVGAQNYHSPGSINLGQPTTFMTGIHDAHSTYFSCQQGNESLSWTLSTSTLEAPARSERVTVDCSHLPCDVLGDVLGLPRQRARVQVAHACTCANPRRLRDDLFFFSSAGFVRNFTCTSVFDVRNLEQDVTLDWAAQSLQNYVSGPILAIRKHETHFVPGVLVTHAVEVDWECQQKGAEISYAVSDSQGVRDTAYAGGYSKRLHLTPRVEDYTFGRIDFVSTASGLGNDLDLCDGAHCGVPGYECPPDTARYGDGEKTPADIAFDFEIMRDRNTHITERRCEQAHNRTGPVYWPLLNTSIEMMGNASGDSLYYYAMSIMDGVGDRYRSFGSSTGTLFQEIRRELMMLYGAQTYTAGHGEPAISGEDSDLIDVDDIAGAATALMTSCVNLMQNASDHTRDFIESADVLNAEIHRVLDPELPIEEAIAYYTQLTSNSADIFVPSIDTRFPQPFIFQDLLRSRTRFNDTVFSTTVDAEYFDVALSFRRAFSDYEFSDLKEIYDGPGSPDYTYSNGTWFDLAVVRFLLSIGTEPNANLEDDVEAYKRVVNYLKAADAEVGDDEFFAEIGWTCSPSEYNDGFICNCGCGTLDPDCISRSVAARFCDTEEFNLPGGVFKQVGYRCVVGSTSSNLTCSRNTTYTPASAADLHPLALTRNLTYERAVELSLPSNLTRVMELVSGIPAELFETERYVFKDTDGFQNRLMPLMRIFSALYTIDRHDFGVYLRAVNAGIMFIRTYHQFFRKESPTLVYKERAFPFSPYALIEHKEGVPSGWRCPQDWYNATDGVCHCECATDDESWDPDCGGSVDASPFAYEASAGLYCGVPPLAPYVLDDLTPDVFTLVGAGFKCVRGATSADAARCKNDATPAGWRCPDWWYGQNGGVCDCACATDEASIDPDCAKLTRYEVPAEWTCPESWYGRNDRCDCTCGSFDPDCVDEPASHCGAFSLTPPEWTCYPGFYDANDGCDCGCGALDPDCARPYFIIYGCYNYGDLYCDANAQCTADPDAAGTADDLYQPTLFYCRGNDTCTDVESERGTKADITSPNNEIAGQNPNIYFDTFQCSADNGDLFTPTMRPNLYGWIHGRPQDWRCENAGDSGYACVSPGDYVPPVQPTPPPNWRCAAYLYGDGEKCDCNCCPDGTCIDPDCGDIASRPFRQSHEKDIFLNCVTGQDFTVWNYDELLGTLMLSPYAQCSLVSGVPRCTKAVPLEWTCSPYLYNSSYYSGDGEACQCGCGCLDPKCLEPHRFTLGCADETNACGAGGTCLNSNYYSGGTVDDLCPIVDVPSETGNIPYDGFFTSLSSLLSRTDEARDRLVANAIKMYQKAKSYGRTNLIRFADEDERESFERQLASLRNDRVNHLLHESKTTGGVQMTRSVKGAAATRAAKKMPSAAAKFRLSTVDEMTQGIREQLFEPKEQQHRPRPSIKTVDEIMAARKAVAWPKWEQEQFGAFFENILVEMARQHGRTHARDVTTVFSTSPSRDSQEIAVWRCASLLAFQKEFRHWTTSPFWRRQVDEGFFDGFMDVMVPKMKAAAREQVDAALATGAVDARDHAALVERIDYLALNMGELTTPKMPYRSVREGGIPLHRRLFTVNVMASRRVRAIDWNRASYKRQWDEETDWRTDNAYVVANQLNLMVMFMQIASAANWDPAWMRDPIQAESSMAYAVLCHEMGHVLDMSLFTGDVGQGRGETSRQRLFSAEQIYNYSITLKTHHNVGQWAFNDDEPRGFGSIAEKYADFVSQQLVLRTIKKRQDEAAMPAEQRRAELRTYFTALAQAWSNGLQSHYTLTAGNPYGYFETELRGWAVSQTQDEFYDAFETPRPPNVPRIRVLEEPTPESYKPVLGYRSGYSGKRGPVPAGWLCDPDDYGSFDLRCRCECASDAESMDPNCAGDPINAFLFSPYQTNYGIFYTSPRLSFVQCDRSYLQGFYFANCAINAQSGVPECVNPKPLPEKWKCPPQAYGDGLVCDCECAMTADAIDPDCLRDTGSLPFVSGLSDMELRCGNQFELFRSTFELNVPEGTRCEMPAGTHRPRCVAPAA